MFVLSAKVDFTCNFLFIQGTVLTFLVRIFLDVDHLTFLILWPIRAMVFHRHILDYVDIV